MDYIEDEGWDIELIKGGSARGFTSIRQRLLDKGLVAYSNGTTYIFLSSLNSWASLVAPDAQIQICGITGSDNVSVSYLGATVPYIPYMEKHAIRIGSIPTSVCIGTRRLILYVNKERQGMDLTVYTGVTSSIAEEEEESRVTGFCLMPCSFHILPTSWKKGTSRRLFNYLNVLFANETELNTIMWIIGNSVIDPGTISKFLLLYGPGGTGKSTVIRAIETVLKGCCSTIKPGTLTDIRDDISLDTARAIASNRFLTAGEINLETGKLNLHNVKIMTGHDSIAIPPIKVATRCTVAAGSNDIPDPKIQKAWCSTAIARRVVVCVMNIDISTIPKLQMPDSEEDALDFLMNCIYIKSTCDNMPMSTRNILYTLLGYQYNKALDKIEITQNCTEQEVFDANVGLDIYLGLELHTIGRLASLISQDCVYMISGLYFLKNIRLKEPLVTE